MAGDAKVILKAGKEQSLLRRHPWVFSGAVDSVQGETHCGATVDVYSRGGRWLARGAWSPHSQIRARIWTFEQDEPVDSRFFGTRLRRCSTMRSALESELRSDAYRLVNAESDGLPGLVVDCYGRFLVCQFLSAGSEYWRHTIVEQLQHIGDWDGIYERSDEHVRLKEGLEPRAGQLWGEAPPSLIPVEEDGCAFLVDVREGHKTGFYLDQRVSRRRVAALAAGTEILNCFAYTGAFGIAALRAGADLVTSVDSSERAGELSRMQLDANRIERNRVEHVRADVFSLLRQYRDRRRSFNVIVLDPPKFVESRSQLIRGSRGYKDINLLALKLLRAGGLLATFSCSGLVKAELFQKIVADAAVDAARDVVFIDRFSQAHDHPVRASFPEGWYLKGLLCRVE